MTIRKLLAVGLVFVGFSLAWIILGNVNTSRTEKQSQVLLTRVQNAYGGPLVITPPQIFYEVVLEKTVTINGIDTVSKHKQKELVDPSKTDISIDLRMERKKAGNLWFPVFTAAYQGEYEYNFESIPREYRAQSLFLLPGLNSSESLFNNIEMKIDDTVIQPLSKLVAGTPVKLEEKVILAGNVKVVFNYKTTGTDYMLYVISGQKQHLPNPDNKENFSGQINNVAEKYDYVERLTRLDDFSVKVTTDFKNYDFPVRTIPPTDREAKGNITEFYWNFNKTVTGKNIGIIIPKLRNPGEIAGRISFFAPVSLLFFFVVMIIISLLIKKVLHPMHYFFLAATFLSFHLMFSYIADHVSIYLAFGIAAVISCLLTFSFLVRIHRWRYAVSATSLQFLYLIIFSWSFFYKTSEGLGITGLIVTVVSVITLFLLMRLTGKINWDEVFPRR